MASLLGIFSMSEPTVPKEIASLFIFKGIAMLDWWERPWDIEP